MNLRNIFAFDPLTAEERKEFRKEQKEIEDASRATIEAGQECLGNELFQKYAREYEAMEKELINIGINTTITDPKHYNALCRMIFANLKVCRLLLQKVRGDAIGR